MSNLVLPAFPGWDISFKRSAEWKNTLLESDSGRDFAIRHWVTPRYRYEMKLNLLRSGTERELQSFIGFFNTHRGSYDTWLFEDPDDRAVTLEQFGIGNGAATQFQLTRSWDTWVDAIYELNGTPRLFRSDWAGSTELFSTPRTNLLARSQEFDNAAWVKSGTSSAPSVMANAVAAPDGNSTADKLVRAAVAGTNYLRQVPTLSAGQAVVFSIYCKAADAAQDQIRVGLFSDAVLVRCDATTGVATVLSGTATASSQNVGSGWWRFSIAAVVPGTNYSVQIYTKDNLASSGTEGIYLWGAQLEVAASVTGYIPTSAATFTRTDFSITKGLATLAVAPVSGALLSWTGNYFWRCRFDTDVVDVTRFLSQMYETGKVTFKTHKP